MMKLLLCHVHYFFHNMSSLYFQILTRATSFPPLALWSMQDPGLLQDLFQALLSRAIFLHPLAPIFCRSFSTSYNHLFLGFPTDRLDFGIFLKTLAAMLCSGILPTHPNPNTVVFLSEILAPPCSVVNIFSSCCHLESFLSVGISEVTPLTSLRWSAPPSVCTHITTRELIKGFS